MENENEEKELTFSPKLHLKEIIVDMFITIMAGIALVIIAACIVGTIIEATKLHKFRAQQRKYAAIPVASANPILNGMFGFPEDSSRSQK